MKNKVIFEDEGKKLTVTSVILFALVLQGSQNKRVCLTIDLFDKIRCVATVLIDVVPPHTGYNCIRGQLKKPVVATHCYVTLTEITGIKELSDVIAVGTLGANT